MILQKNQLGNSDLMLSSIGQGTWAIGGPWKFGWGQQDEQASIDTIKSAIDCGINWIDTAHVYGHGLSEEIVGRAIKGKRDSLIIATKCGLLKGKNEEVKSYLKADSVRNECEGSLKRLQIDTIDLYQIHWPDPEYQIEEAWIEIGKLIQEGKIRYGGVSNFNVKQLKKIHQIRPITSLQPPYSLIKRGIEGYEMDFCHQNNIGIIGYSPMGCGLLTGKVTQEWVQQLPGDDFRKNHDPNFREPNLSKNLEIVETLKKIANKHHAEPGQIAVAWTIHNQKITSAIVGARNASQVESNIKSTQIKLDPEDMKNIEKVLPPIHGPQRLSRKK